jgi:2-C-methyl-D-erythritol 4-phosphate cytidylyltransferase
VSSSTASSAERASAVIVAGGSGQRFGADRPKQYLDLAGEPVLSRAVRVFVEHAHIGAVVVVLPAQDAANPPDWLARLGVEIVAGGAERGDSVWNGLCRTPERADVVVIHDGARPLVAPALVDRVLAGVGPASGAIVALPVADTLKRVDGARQILATEPREGLWQAQTPQAFPRSLLLDVHERARRLGLRGTDDASLLEHFGHPVRVVEGSPYNLKVTRPADLALAEALARSGVAR